MLVITEQRHHANAINVACILLQQEMVVTAISQKVKHLFSELQLHVTIVAHTTDACLRCTLVRSSLKSKGIF